MYQEVQRSTAHKLVQQLNQAIEGTSSFPRSALASTVSLRYFPSRLEDGQNSSSTTFSYKYVHRQKERRQGKISSLISFSFYRLKHIFQQLQSRVLLIFHWPQLAHKRLLAEGNVTFLFTQTSNDLLSCERLTILEVIFSQQLNKSIAV